MSAFAVALLPMLVFWFVYPAVYCVLKAIQLRSADNCLRERLAERLNKHVGEGS